MRRTYYELTVPIKPGFALPDPATVNLKKNVIAGWLGLSLADPKQWKEPPHVALANLGHERLNHAATIEQACMFVKRHGLPMSDEQYKILGPGEPFEIAIRYFRAKQDQLRYAWERKDSKALWFDSGLENLDLFYLPVTWATGGLELQPADCWTHLRLLLTRDLATKRARICANSNCPAPYFIATRGNKIFCTHACANAVAQRNLRKRRAR